MLPSSSTRSHSSSSTLKLSSPPSNRPDFLDSDHSDEDHESLDPTTPKQPSSSYADRLNSLLGREAGGGDEQDEEGGGAEDDDADFRYDGQDGIDEERQEQRLAEWAEDEEDEKGSIRDYDQTMKDILGEEEAREEAQAQGEEELESFAVERGVGFDDDVRSDKTPSTSSQTNLGFSASFSPTSHGRSPSGSIASSSKLQSSRRPPFLHPTVSRLRSHMRNPSSSSSIQTTNGYGNGNGLLPRSASTSSHFSQLSRTTSSSTIHSLLQQPTQPSNGPASSSRPPPPPKRAEDPFHYTSLKRISAFLFPNPSKGATSAAKLAAMGLGAGAGAGGQELKREMLGKPVMIVVGGLICVGTDKGWVGTWGFGGEAKGWYGNETISKEAGPVTALSLSPDHTYIAVGHAQGHIYLYQLNNSSSPSPPPSKSSRSSSSSTSGGSFIPTRTALPIQLSSALLGKREGHLLGTRILHIGFVGKRHTAIVSGDERGMAFYHSLGRVLGVDSTDVLRVLGSYPTEGPQGGSRPTPTSTSTHSTPSSSTKPPPITTLFATAPLPLGPHASDTYQLSALLTPSKLVIVGLKPSPRTWYRKLRSLGAGLAEGGEEGGLVGGAVWRTGASTSLPSLEKGGAMGTEERDPLLAFWWGSVVRFVGVRVVEVEAGGVGNVGEVGGGKKGAAGESVKRVEFLEAGSWEAEGVVRGLKWLNEHHLLVLTSSALSVLDTRTMDRVERSDIDCRMLISNDFYSEVQRRRTKHHTIIENGNGHESATSLSSVAGSFSSYKGKVFFLTKADVRTGSIISWTDRLLALMEVGDILSAIRLATTYYLGSHRSTVLGLPETTPERKKLVGSRLEELIRSSLRYTFSDDRMTDGTHESRDGRGVDRTELFEGLVTETANACLALDDLDFFFDDVFERYQDVGIEGIFFDQLEPFILEGRIRTIPTNVVQRLFQLLDDRDQLEKLETIIWHVDPRCLDINQAITICQKHRLWDALVYVYTRSLADFVSPVVELLGVVRRIQQHRIERPQRVGGESWSMRNGGTGGGLTDDEVEALVPDAYKLYSYLSDVLSGLAYPSKEVMSDEESIPAKTSVYSFVFSGRTTSGIQGGPLIATVSKGNSEPTYPYLRLLLQFDAEAFLHAMDIAFEDSYLNDDVTDKDISRQLIINLMLDAMDPEEFSPSDVTLLHIFVSRNLPKYPQFIILPPSTLHRILEALATDPDQSTREDRQLAAEYLLSAYTPHDTDRMLALFESAGFFRILRSTYRAERKWAALVSTYFKDPDSGFDVFASVDEILAVASSSKSSVPEELKETVLEAIPHLSDFGIRQTALLVDRHLPSSHKEALQSLSSSPHKQYGYLRCLLEPCRTDEEEEIGPLPPRTAPSTNLDAASRHLYISLLSRHDPSSVVRLLEESPKEFFDLTKVVDICEELGPPEAVVWALDRQGHTRLAFAKVGDVIQIRGSDLGGGFIALSEGDVGSSHQDLQEVRNVTRMGVKLCLEHSSSSSTKDAKLSSTAQLPLEDMWFGILHELIELVHSVSGILPSSQPPRSPHHSTLHLPPLPLDSPPPQSLDSVVLDSLRSLVQETLSSLVSSTSNSSLLSFPRLFKHLVEASSTPTTPGGSGPKDPRAYSEFRSILTGMMETYRLDTEVLGVTIRLVERDLFESVKEMTRQRVKGWRPSIEAWGKGEVVAGTGEGKGKGHALVGEGKEEEQTEATRSKGIVVFRSGRVAPA